MGNWAEKSKLEIIYMLNLIIDEQEAFGKKQDLKNKIDTWELFLSDLFTTDQVMEAIKILALEKNTVPKMADVKNKIQPPPPQISYEQYRQAMRAKENGEGMFDWSHESRVISKYHAQQNGTDDNDNKRLSGRTGGLKKISLDMKRIENE